MTGRLRALAAACALALSLTACTSSPTDSDDDPAPSSAPASSSEAESTPPDPGPRPRVGQCHQLGFAQAVALVGRTEPIACKRRHTAETFFVGRLDLATKSGFTRRVDSRAAQRQVRTTCARRLPAHLGRTPLQLRLSMAQAVWFVPSPRHAEAGADWFRCDLVVVAAPRSLMPLPRRTRAWGDTPAIAMCATAAPGTKAFRRVTCGTQHSWRAVSTVDLAGGAKLPEQAAIAARMESACREVARSNADDPLDFTWSQESPTAEQWAAGQRYGICWVPA